MLYVLQENFEPGIAWSFFYSNMSSHSSPTPYVNTKSVLILCHCNRLPGSMQLSQLMLLKI